MIKQIKLTNWKSFGDTTLYIDPLTVVMGLNASGKSNLVEALSFLQRSVTTRDLFTALNGDRYLPPIRGGSKGALRSGKRSFTIETLIGSEDENIDYQYSISVGIDENNNPVLKDEFLNWMVKEEGKPDGVYPIGEYVMSEIDAISEHIGGRPRKMDKTAQEHNVFNFNKSDTVSCLNVLSKMGESSIHKNVIQYIEIPPVKKPSFFTTIVKTFENIFILDIIPQKARDYAAISPVLANDGSNFHGFLMSLPKEECLRIERIISEKAQHLPERELVRVYIEKIAKTNDAMLFAEERINDTKTLTSDIRQLSDGTLRFLIILTAILTVPKGTLIVIEEIDNGIHPSRAKFLLDLLYNEGSQRGVDVLVTTHNSAFLNVLTDAYLPFVMLVHRDETGASCILPVEEAEDLTYLLGQGNLGDIVANERLLKRLTHRPTPQNASDNA